MTVIWTVTLNDSYGVLTIYERDLPLHHELSRTLTGEWKRIVNDRLICVYASGARRATCVCERVDMGR